MAKHKVFISPSDQRRNTYASGNTNEAEVCGRIGAACRAALERCGFAVELVQYEPMSSKCAKSDAFGAELHLPIHTNAFNGKTSGTRIMCYALSGEGYKACKAIFDVLAPLTPGTMVLFLFGALLLVLGMGLFTLGVDLSMMPPGTSENITAHPELYEIKNASAPTAYVEVDFHDVPEVAAWLTANTETIGETIAKGVCNYFGEAYIPAGGNKADEPIAQPAGVGAWSAEARAWAIETGLINGVGKCSDGTTDYAWTDNVTREQLVTILHRLAGLTQ